ncbi:MAG: signal peptidase II [Oscillospiraceae bacterium]|nr:signal peptidase II [Oscillospiraceae bacterium]
MLYVIVAALLIVLDQWVKIWTVSNFSGPGAGTMEFLPGVVELTRVHNYGAGWSSFSGQRWFLAAVSVIVVGLVLFAVCKRLVRHPVGLVAATLVTAGGIGNLIDRVRLGYVVDMFHFEFWPSYPVFNVADICIVIGGVLAVIYYLFLYEKYDARKRLDGDADTPSE